MSSIKSRSIAMLLSLILLFTALLQPLQAAEYSTDSGVVDPAASSGGGIMPLWENARTFTITLDCSGSKVEIYAKVTALLGSIYKNGYVKLEKISGYNVGIVKEWKNLSSGTNIFSFSDNSITAEEGKYKVTVQVDVVRFGVSENLKATKEDTH